MSKSSERAKFVAWFESLPFAERAEVWWECEASTAAEVRGLLEKTRSELTLARAVIAAAQELRGWQSTAPQQTLDSFDAAMVEWRRVKG